MRILLFDNYDSFTYNLYNLLKMVRPSAEIAVLRNRNREVLNADFDVLVISPGPMTPADVGLLPALFEQRIIPRQIPVLGICLGLQFLTHYHQVPVERSTNPLHGSAVEIEHHAQKLFSGLPSPFKVARYNSLEVRPEKLVNSPLHMLAVEKDKGAVMGLEHATMPWVGVQFHPESFLTEHGHVLTDNFFKYYVENRI